VVNGVGKTWNGAKPRVEKTDVRAARLGAGTRVRKAGSNRPIGWMGRRLVRRGLAERLLCTARSRQLELHGSGLEQCYG
jgi:hypothetical protein